MNRLVAWGIPMAVFLVGLIALIVTKNLWGEPASDQLAMAIGAVALFGYISRFHPGRTIQISRRALAAVAAISMVIGFVLGLLWL